MWGNETAPLRSNETAPLRSNEAVPGYLEKIQGLLKNEQSKPSKDRNKKLDGWLRDWKVGGFNYEDDFFTQKPTKLLVSNDQTIYREGGVNIDDEVNELQALTPTMLQQVLEVEIGGGRKNKRTKNKRSKHKRTKRKKRQTKNKKKKRTKKTRRY